MDIKQKYANILMQLASEKEFHKISVEEIVVRSGYSKPTFYKHFSDKYDLAFYVYTSQMTKHLDEYADDLGYFKMMNAMLNTFRANLKFYKNVFKASHLQNSFLKQFHEYSMDYNRTLIGARTLNNELYDILELFTHGVLAFLNDWIQRGAKESNEYMLSIFVRAMPPELKPHMISEAELFSED